MENGETIYSSIVTLVKTVWPVVLSEPNLIQSFKMHKPREKKINKAFGMFFEKFYYLSYILKLGTYIHVHTDIIINSICVQYI